MDIIESKIFRYLIILLLLLCVHQTEPKRSKNSGGRRTTPRSHQHTTQSHHHTTQSHNRQDIGFENVQHRAPPQNSPPTQPIGFNVPQGSNGHQSPAGDAFQKTNVNQVGSNPLNPSAPVAPPANNPGIGFENVQNRVPPQNNPPIGFNPPPNAGGGYHPQSGVPSAPVGSVNNQNLGFDNVHNRVPPQGNQPPYPNFPQNTGGYHPQGGAQNPGYHPQNQPNYQNGYNPNTGYNPQYPGGFGGHPGNYYQNQGQFGGGGGVYNPQSYYNPHFSTPNGVPPQIYQPVQQSSGSSLLGYAGTFAGGYLIGKLTSGGGGHDSGDRQYTVHHYHHNADQVPKQINVADNNLVTCSQNDTQGLCVPNTFPICLANGTIMCATHAPFTVPCGSNSSTACVVTVLPCASGDTKCDNSTANFTNTAVYVPCISNVTVAKRRVTENNATVNATADQIFNTSKVELCVTAIAEPKKMESPVGSYLNVIAQLSMLPLEMMQPANGTANDTMYGVAMQVMNSMNNPPETTTANTTLNSTTQIPIITTMNTTFNYNTSSITTQAPQVPITSTENSTPVYNIQTVDLEANKTQVVVAV